MKVATLPILVALLVAPGAAPAKTTSVDSTAALTPPAKTTLFRASAIDTVSRPQYFRYHAFSFDQFLEQQTRFVIERSGPIGNSVAVSRYGFGHGRAEVLVSGIPINDPQTGVAPLAHLPVSAIGRVRFGTAASGGIGSHDGIEGRIEIDEADPPLGRPQTFIDLSKGDNDLRQRRVRFSSASASCGVDIDYDELLDDGYSFDARRLGDGFFVSGPDFGRSRSRLASARLRGVLPSGETYRMTFRHLTSSGEGDLVSAARERRLAGHLASVAATVGPVEVTLYERGYNSTLPDSHTVNQTTAAQTEWRWTDEATRNAHVAVGFENITARQEVGGAQERTRLRKTTLRVALESKTAAALTLRARASAVDYHGYKTGVGGALELVRPVGEHEVGLELRRGFRMPSLGELFLPPHSVGGVTLAGNASLAPETSLEAAGRVALRMGPLASETRIHHVAVRDPVVTRDNSQAVTPVNGDGERITVIDERLLVDTAVRGLEVNVDAGVIRAEGDREDYFLSVPKTTFHAGFRFGRSLFESTSALYFGADFYHRSSRRAPGASVLPSYSVLNLKLDGRLLDANMYLLFLNVFNETYQTVDGYLMTPRTFVYGIAWTLFE